MLDLDTITERVEIPVLVLAHTVMNEPPFEFRGTLYVYPEDVPVIYSDPDGRNRGQWTYPAARFFANNYLSRYWSKSVLVIPAREGHPEDRGTYKPSLYLDQIQAQP